MELAQLCPPPPDLKALPKHSEMAKTAQTCNLGDPEWEGVAAPPNI